MLKNLVVVPIKIQQGYIVMGDCCYRKESELQKTARQHKVVLWLVLLINAFMFVIELIFGWIGHSLALVGDSLDMLGDAMAYASSIYVAGLSIKEKASVARFKAVIMLILGFFTSGQCLYRSIYPVIPEFDIMFIIGVFALAMNLACLYLLTRHRNDDINMRSVWICSRNDIVANTSVLVAAALVTLSGSPYPDLIVGIGLALLFTKSAIKILNESRTQELNVVSHDGLQN